jgi:NAD(P)-dependent dehydrogenase (short-subunit alcohol dehydrogenase family)
MAATGRVAGKVALVTGGGAGLGRADCLALAREGARVVVTDIDADAARAVAAECGHDAIALGQDVSSEARWAEVIAEVEARCGGLHVLVNNAGIVVVKSPEDTTLEEFRRVNAVMSEGVFLGCRAALALKARGGGRIINIGSIMSEFGGPGLCAYGTSKHAIAGLTKAMATDLGPYGITANTLQPGAIWTAISRPFFDDPDFRSYWEGKAPLGRIGEPDDIAGPALFLASDASRFVTGAGLRVCGGAMARF